MKHVFYVNSHTTLLTSLGILARYPEICSSDVIFLYPRNYKNNIVNAKFREYDFTELNNIGNSCYESRKKSVIAISVLDKFVADHIADRYKLYVPHMCMGTAQILYTNESCIDVSYVQEGALCQPKRFITNLSPKETLKKIIKDILHGTSKRYWRMPAWHQEGTLYKQSILVTYAFTKDFFANLRSNNVIIKWPKLEIKSIVPDGSRVFVFDGYVANGIIESDYYMNVCNEIINLYAKPDNYIKFHPAQSTEERDNILSFFHKRGVVVHISDDNTPFELVLASKNNLEVVGFSSSLLIYAKELRHKVYANDHLLKESSLYSNHIKESGYPLIHDYLNK